MDAIASKMPLPFYRKKHQDSSLNVELSTNKLTPGILKIFGDHVSPGSNYKAVRVSTISTAEEVVREALEKFNLERSNPKDFVLCDVIGQFISPTSPTSDLQQDGKQTEGSDKQKKKGLNRKPSKGKTSDLDNGETTEWVTEYVRAINEIEKPLVLQSLWKPTNGKSRRFELRNRIELENSFFFINHATTGEARSSAPNGLHKNSNDVSTDAGHQESPNTPDTTTPRNTSARYSRRLEEPGADTAPLYEPYLILLKGCNDKDKLIQKLHDPTMIVGSYAESEKKQCDIILYSPDILLPHCWLYKKLSRPENETETDFDNLKYLAFVEPANGADVTINGKFVKTTTALRPGEIVTFGHDYVFLFKDQTTVKDSQIELPWLDYIKNDSKPQEAPAEPEYAYISKRKDTRDKCIQVDLPIASLSPTSQNHVEAVDDTDTSFNSDYHDDEQRNDDEEVTMKNITKSLLQLSYNVEDEDDLLHAIIDICDGEIGPFKLLPSYLFIMAIEHSAASFSDNETRKLLLKISSGLQSIAWEKTKEIGKNCPATDGNTTALANHLLPELKPVLFWLTNALQMLHFLQCNLKKYLLAREDVRSRQNSVITADEELLSVLEEVIMFTFQQLVYHLTKILYGALPSVLEVNPFQSSEDGDDDEDEDAKRVHPSILQLTSVLNDVLLITQEHQVHQQIITQIFSYLFFFCNALLFNSLLEKGPTTKIFRWAKGVQIRGNIDAIEEWAQVNGLGAQFSEYFGKFISVIGLLSTPKAQLLQCKWNQLRADYPLLNPAQLQLILGEYQLGGKEKPRGWYPSPDEVEAALRSSDVLESFLTHPPLMLPSNNFILDLNVHPNNEDFSRHVQTLNEKFNKSEEQTTIQPNIRSHSLTIPKLEIKPNPSTLEHYAREESAVRDIESTTDKSRSPGNSKSSLMDSTKDDVPKTIKASDRIIKVDVHSSIPATDKQDAGFVINDPLNVNTHSPTPTSPRGNPPRSTVDFDPDFADDLKDMKDRVMPTNIGTNVDLGISNGNVYHVELIRENKVLGLGLIDGQFTPMKNNGIYIRTIVPNTPASTEPRLRIGDRILSVNNENVFDKDYSYAMGLIKSSGDKISLLVSVSTDEIVSQIMAVA